MIAKYTKLFSDFIADNPNYLTTLVDFDSPLKEELIDRITNRWKYFEICSFDFSAVAPNNGYEDFKIYFSCIYNLYKNYYKELLTNYKKDYDYALGNKKTTTVTGTSAGHNTATNTSADTKYSLPNKVATNEYPTFKESGSDTVTGSTDGNNSETSSTTYDDEFLQLKKQYMEQIRDLDIEFANRFNDCFLHLM